MRATDSSLGSLENRCNYGEQAHFTRELGLRAAHPEFNVGYVAVREKEMR